MHDERADALFRLRATTTSADSRCSRRLSTGGDDGTTLFRSVSADEDGGNAANIAASEASNQTQRDARAAPIRKRSLMMARRPSKHLRPARPLSSGHATSVIKSDGRWIVRSVSGAAATKTYRCPGCNVEIRPGTPHVVTWPDTPGLDSQSPVEERRHWHTSCWQRRP
jgi:hypothetical protein